MSLDGGSDELFKAPLQQSIFPKLRLAKTGINQLSKLEYEQLSKHHETHKCFHNYLHTSKTVPELESSAQ